MTRHNRRDIQSEIDELRIDSDAGDVEEWVREYIEQQTVEMEFCVQLVDVEGNVTTQFPSGESDGICIGIAAPWRYYAEPGDIPGWITPEQDLPVNL